MAERPAIWSAMMKEDSAADFARDLVAAQRGDRAAFGRIYDRHAAVVLSLCRARLRDCTIDEAEDACHETFIRAMHRLEQVNEPAGLRSWLYAIARHVCSERDRAARRRSIHESRHIAMRNGAAASGAQHRDDSGGGSGAAAAQRTENDEALCALNDAIRALPDREQISLHLYYLEADPVNAAREALGLSRSGFYKVLNRARRMVAEALGATQPQRDAPKRGRLAQEGHVGKEATDRRSDEATQG